MFKFKQSCGLSAVPVVVILMLCGVVVSIFTFNTGKTTTTAALDGTYQSYETLTGEEIQDPYYPPGSTPGGVGNIGGGSGSGSVPGPTIPDEEDNPLLNNIIPEGGTYTAADGTVYNPGDEMPETVTTGDIYTYGDYNYCYNGYANDSNYGRWDTDETQNGWGVRLRYSNKSTPGEILESINGQPITDMRNTFTATGITTIPSIPSSVTDMDRTFYQCYYLVDASSLVIPDGVTSLYYTFEECHRLQILPDISNETQITNMNLTFMNCSSIVDLSDYVIPNGVQTMSQTFMGCKRLEKAPQFPDDVSIVASTFWNCTALTVAPKIPESATNISMTFYGCTSLTGEIQIPCTIKSIPPYGNCTATVVYYHVSGCNSSCGK